jgi:hypothetical protein
MTMWLLTGTLGIGLGGTALAAKGQTTEATQSAQAQPGKGMTMAEIPSVVRRTIHREAKGGTVEGISKQSHGASAVYSAEIMKNGKTTNIAVDPYGMVLARTPHRESVQKGQK